MELLHICSTDNHCKSAVETHFQKCFDNNFDKNKVGLYNGFAPYEFSECMNKNAKADYFKPIWLSDL